MPKYTIEMSSEYRYVKNDSNVIYRVSPVFSICGISNPLESVAFFFPNYRFLYFNLFIVHINVS